MVLGRNEKGQCYARMYGGKDVWEKTIGIRFSNPPYNEQFHWLLQAVRRGDIYDIDGQAK